MGAPRNLDELAAQLEDHDLAPARAGRRRRAAAQAEADRHRARAETSERLADAYTALAEILRCHPRLTLIAEEEAARADRQAAEMFEDADHEIEQAMTWLEVATGG